jgi:uncharacterized protein (TIGR03437 family)
MNRKTWLRSIATGAMTCIFSVAALGDINSTATLSAGSGFSFDSGATSSSGDIVFTGTSITFQGSAKGGVLPGLTGSTGYSEITLAILQELASFASNAPIPASSIPVGAIVGVGTNAGNSAKFLVTAISSSSLSFQFTTYGANSTGPGTPTITGIQNNSSSIPAGFPNYGIPPSSLFKILGANLAAAGNANLQDSTQGLPLTLNQASLSVTVNGTTVHPAIYYATPTQIDAVLPAATPIGTGTLTVTNNGTASSPAQIQVVASAPGLTTYNGSAVAQIANTAPILTYTNSGAPGNVIILWGTGLGADPGDSDTTYTGTPHTINTPLQIYIGGVQVSNIAYVGASVYPGVDVIGLTIPAGAPSGCYVPVAVVAGSGASSVVSNIATLPIMPNGGVCVDSLYGINGTQISQASGQSTVSSGIVFVVQSTSPDTKGGTQVTSEAAAIFESVTGSSYAGGSGDVSLNGCSLNQTVVTTSGTIPTVTGLDAGTITVTEPSGTQAALSSVPTVTGDYFAQLASGAIPATGGTFTFTGSGGAQVGPFTATVSFPNPLLNWTNQSAAATVNRTQGLSVTWTGGASGALSFVVISGSSSNSSVSGRYTCIAPTSAGQFTVPSYILLGLPAGNGTTSVGNDSNYSTFSATGINSGLGFGAVSFQVNTVYQ